MQLHPSSVVVSAARPHEPGAPLNTPIVPAAPYRNDSQDNRYARHDVTATVAAFEMLVGALEGGRALAFASGIAALATVLDTLPVGAIVVVPDEGYSGTVSTFRDHAASGRLQVRHCAPGDLAADVCAGAALVWLESVSNPLMTVADIPAAAALAHAAGALLGVDATFSTPLVTRPLDLGADLVMHSATKYLSGHSDALMGVLATRSEQLADTLHERRTLGGAIPGALEAYLATRGIRTLAIRMERAQANALDLASRLGAHPRVTRVRYPGLPDDPGYPVAARDHAGFGAIVAIELAGTAQDAERVCTSLRLIMHATSLGGVESTIERRARYEVDESFGTPPTLLRLSVGIEHVEDLWADLERALSG